MTPSSRPWYRRPLPLVGLLVLVFFLAGATAFGAQVYHYWSLLKAGKGDTIKRERLKASVSKVFQAKQEVSAADISRVMQTGDNPVLGNPKADVKIVELVDYGCPYCRQAAPVVRAFMASHRDSVFLVLKDFPLTDIHPTAEAAAIAARCVYVQGNLPRYWAYHDRLFASQEAQSASDLRTYAEQGGVDMAAYDTCVKRQTPLVGIQKSLEEGVAAGAQGTPTFFVNGVAIQGAMDTDLLEAVVEEARHQTGSGS